MVGSFHRRYSTRWVLCGIEREAGLTDIPMKKDSVVVCKTNRDDLVLRSNPTNAAVRKFVKEHHRRFKAGEPGGPDGSLARQIFSATRYAHEADYLIGREGTPIKIEDIIKR